MLLVLVLVKKKRTKIRRQTFYSYTRYTKQIASQNCIILKVLKTLKYWSIKKTVYFLSQKQTTSYNKWTKHPKNITKICF